MNVLPFETQVRIISALTEGCSIRSTERLTETHRDTVMRLGVRVGEGCARLHDRLMRDLQVNLIELDEQWDFIAKKAKRVQTNDPAEFGDVWLFVALASTQKAVISYRVGKRTQENTTALARDLRARIVNRPQVTSDGYAPYVGAIQTAFGRSVDFAVLTKQYGGDSNLPDAAHRYSPGHVTGVERTVIRGRPNRDLISTSYVERFNLSSRMQMRRCTRLTNAYSKKLTNHEAAVSLWVCFYNLCRVHETLRCTPAMALGVTDHIWSIAELVQAALEPQDVPPLPQPTPETTLRPGTRRFRLIVGRGGKGTNMPRP
ncbi:MAG TPA: IS1 family transposase [Candidatus Binataceae bacterium]|nr:IS1 family transposase [Candidatus Binataceae bacterium]